MKSLDLHGMDSLDYIEVSKRPETPIPNMNGILTKEIIKDTTTPQQKMVSACLGSLLTSLLVTPLDVIKTRLQHQSINTAAANAPLQLKNCINLCTTDSYALCTVSPHSRLNVCQWPISNISLASSFSSELRLDRRLNGTLDAFYKIARFEGISKLWRGLSPALLQSFPSTVIYYVGYDALRDRLYEHIKNPTMSFYVPLMAGALSRSLSATVISPIELFRTRLQSASGTSSFKDVSKDVIKMVRHQGFRSLWMGLTPTLWRDVPFSAIYWLSYEHLKKNLNASQTYSLTPIVNSFIAGSISGAISAIITTPFDVIKTRHQLDSLPKNLNTIQVLKHILIREGVAELFRGMVPRVAKVAPACAIMVSTYEGGKRWFAAGE